MRTTEWTGPLGGQHQNGRTEERTLKLKGRTESTSFLEGRAFLTGNSMCKGSEARSLLCERRDPQNSRTFSSVIQSFLLCTNKTSCAHSDGTQPGHCSTCLSHVPGKGSWSSVSGGDDGSVALSYPGSFPSFSEELSCTNN